MGYFILNMVKNPVAIIAFGYWKYPFFIRKNRIDILVYQTFCSQNIILLILLTYNAESEAKKDLLMGRNYTRSKNPKFQPLNQVLLDGSKIYEIQ